MYPNWGEKSVQGHLRSIGLKVQRWRVRESLKRVCPSAVKERFRRAIHRREYSYHKLIRWRIVIHSGVDGYARIPVYLVAPDNNRATTVLDGCKKVRFTFSSKIR